jgi:hypothetical protein
MYCHAVLRDVKADFVPLGAGVFAGREGLVNLIPYLLPDRVALRQSFIVAAGVQGGGHGEEGLGTDQGDCRSCGIDQ